MVLVWTHDSGDAGNYSSEHVPLFAKDGSVFGSGGQLVDDDPDQNYDWGQEEMLLNIIDSYTGGSGHILYDETTSPGATLSGNFSNFSDWVGNNGYTISASTDLTQDLSDADALIVTPPGGDHASDQISAIQDFINNGNPVILMNRADDWDTDSLNYLASQLNLAFRFDDDAVSDASNGYEYDDWPRTDVFDDEAWPSYFENRLGMGMEPGNTYRAEIVEVVDGDTFDIQHVGGYYDGQEDTIRHLGFDTPETSKGGGNSSSDEWVGIEDTNYLDDWGDKASNYVKDNFSAGDVIDVWVDDDEFARGLYNRLLAYCTYPDGHSKENTNYNRDMVDLGYARVYNSGFSDHSVHNDLWWDARANGRRVWSESDPNATGVVRNRDVSALKFRNPNSVRTDTGTLGSSRTAVWADSSATQDVGSDGVVYSGDIPLVGVDETNRVALVGGLMNTTGYSDSNDENQVFSANLAQALSDVGHDDMYLIEGGHGQFSVSYDFSREGKEAFQRYLEGLDAMEFEAVNEISSTDVNTDRAHAIVITPPAHDDCYTDSEIDQLRTFRDNGGTIILKHSDEVDDRSRTVLNELANGLGTDLRFNDDSVDVEETSNFNTTDFSLWSAYDTSSSSGSSPTCSTVSPNDGDTVSGTVTIQVDASDSEDSDDSLDVEVSIDGGTWQSATYNSTSGYYEYDWDTTAVSDGDHTIDAQATDSDGNTTGASQLTVTVDNTAEAPTVETLSLDEVETDNSDAEFDADWNVSDNDGDLDTVDLTLTDLDDGETEDSASISVSGDSANGTTRLVATGEDGSGHQYEVEAVVTDTDGNTDSATATATESDSDNAPLVEHINVTENKTNRPHANFDGAWEVSDADGNLDYLEATLVDQDDGETEYSTTVSLSGGSESGSESMEAKKEDGDGHIYEFEIVVYDTNGNSGSATDTVQEDGINN
jgi:endonuclease YncB( thermonuclease family)